MSVAFVRGARVDRADFRRLPVGLHRAASHRDPHRRQVPPYAINLRFGLVEGVLHLQRQYRRTARRWQSTSCARSYAALLLYLILVMGINGMVMTRDLFNLFVFLEIVSIATYGLLGFDGYAGGAGRRLQVHLATVMASTFFLLGSVLLYYVTGTLNIDEMIEPGAITRSGRLRRR